MPGQVLSREILDFLRKLDVTEIHGLRPELGLRVFKEVRAADRGLIKNDTQKDIAGKRRCRWMSMSS